MSLSSRAVRIGAGILGTLAAVTMAYAASTTNYTYDAAGNLTGVTGCTPTTCAAQGNHCGSTPDGCGGTIWCTCAAGQVCNTSNVCVAAPALSLSKTSLSFSGTVGGSNPAAQTITASNSGGGTLATPTTSISYGSGSGWLSASVSGSAAPYTITITPSISGLSAGTYTATISVSSAGATNSPRTVSVTLQVSGSGTAGTFGADPALPGYSDQGIGVLANNVSVGQFNCPVANARVSKISVYASGAWTGHARAVIYADSSGAPGALLGTSNEVTSAASLAWTDFTFPSAVVLGAAGNYWIGVANDATKSLVIFTQSGGTNRYESISYPTIPNPWNPSAQSSSAYRKAWYATYTTSSGTAGTFGVDPALPGYSDQGIGVLANNVSVGQFNCPVANAKVSKISVYTSGAWSGHARAVIYADSSGAPGALLGTSNEVTSAAGLAWTDFTFPSAVVLGAAGNYWIGMANDATKSITIFTKSGGTNLYATISYPTIPNPWNSSNQSSSAYTKAWYATYTTQ